MPRPPCRRFGLLDAMILVASAAFAALSIRPSYTLYGRLTLDLWSGFFPEWLRPTLYPNALITCVVPWLASSTVALLIIGLRPPRPGFRRLMRQPGMAASVAAVSAIVLGGLLAALAIAIMGTVPTYNQLYTQAAIPVIGSAGLAVVAVWIVMALAGRWRAHPGWIDRTGRVLGGCWVLVFLLSTWSTHWLTAIEFRFIAPPPIPQYQATTQELNEQKLEERAESSKDQ